jgi:hypothetical protein
MIRFKKTIAFGLLTSLAVLNSFAEEGEFKLEPLHAYASWEVGQVESFVGTAAAGAADLPGRSKYLIDRAAVWLLQEARLSDNSKVFLGVGGAYFFIVPSKGNQYSFGQRSAFALTDAHGEFEFWKQSESDHGLLLKAGIFPFKYNPDAKNLGEYMFRTYTYPTVIFTGGLTSINSTTTQLNGLDVNTKIGGATNDLMLTVKTDQIPSAALSLTDMFSYTLKDFLTLGAGFMFDNFYDATGLADGTFEDNGTGSLGNGYYFVLKDGSIAYPSNPPAAELIADTAHYTFQGQKVMARAALNLGKILPENQVLSEQDLRLYGEAILMGVKDYPGYYDKIENRIAYMIGFNVPTFRLLDVLSLEYEYCKNPYTSSTSRPAGGFIPLPTNPEKIMNGDNRKWTIFGRKNINKSFSISGQVADDHMRLVDYFGHTNDQEILQTHEDWYWAFQLSYAI